MLRAFSMSGAFSGTVSAPQFTAGNTIITSNYLTMQGVRLVSYSSGIALLDNTGGGACLLWMPRYLAANLPAATSCDGAFAMVSDATAVTPRSVLAGGGANKVMAQSNGTNWIIIG